jgi:hypothetical protein
MTGISSLSDEEVDELLAGHAPTGRADLAPVAAVATSVRRHVAAETAPMIRYPLRHAIGRRAVVVVPRPRPLVHAAMGAAVTVFALAGAADALPAPVQEAVADVGDLVGVEMPHATDEHHLSAHVAAVAIAPNEAAEEEDEGTEPKPYQRPGAVPEGATPADPGSPGDHQAATPATPPPVAGESEASGELGEGEEHGTPDATPDETAEGDVPTSDGADGTEGDTDDGGQASERAGERGGAHDDAGLERRAPVDGQGAGG